MIVRGCFSNDSNPKENVNLPPASNSSQRESTARADTGKNVIPSEYPIPISRYPMDEEWDRTVREYLDSAEDEEDYDKKLSFYMGALYLQSMEYAFKFQIYEESGGENAENQPFARAQAAEIQNTLAILLDSLGEDMTAYMYNFAISECADWMGERISDITFNMGKVVNIKTADINDLWELFLSAYGGAEEFYS